jgi:hypothetical protein
MHMAHRAAAWVAWAVWTCNTPQQGIRSKESGLRPALFLCVPYSTRESLSGVSRDLLTEVFLDDGPPKIRPVVSKE